MAVEMGTVMGMETAMATEGVTAEDTPGDMEGLFATGYGGGYSGGYQSVQDFNPSPSEDLASQNAYNTAMQAPNNNTVGFGHFSFVTQGGVTEGDVGNDQSFTAYGTVYGHDTNNGAYTTIDASSGHPVTISGHPDGSISISHK